MKYILLSLLWLISITGCSSIDIKQYANNLPALELFDYFRGETVGYGMVFDRKGNLTRQFKVLIKGNIDENGSLILDETFHWSDGERSKRVWTIEAHERNQYRGWASDVIGHAVGEISGNVLHWTYRLEVEADSSKWKISFDDWMYLQEDAILINKATMSKFGIHLGEVLISFQKIPGRAK